MSENDPIPSKQTSSIPLKKETVRVTLKAADAPPASPSASIPSAPTVRPPTPTMPPTATAPSARPSPTMPPTATAPAAGGAPRPAPAATIPLKTAPGAGIPRPAPTIALKSGPIAPAAPGTAPAARPSLPGAAPAAGSTISLPKATVQLTPPSQPSVGIPTQKAATLTAVEDEEEEVKDSMLATILSGVGFAAALVVLYLQFGIVKTRVDAPDSESKGEIFTELMK